MGGRGTRRRRRRRRKGREKRAACFKRPLSLRRASTQKPTPSTQNHVGADAGPPKVTPAKGHLCSRLHPPSPPKLEARVARQRLTRCRAPPSAAAELAQDVEGADDGHEDQGQHQDRGGPHL
ncbi:unnamed protein product, partial [Prorocentrum cordatum]